MSRPIINPGSLYWTGQHWIDYIKEPGADTHSGMVSLWHTHYCEAGEGTAVFIDIPGADGYQALCTDNPDIAAFHVAWMKGRGGIHDLDLEVVPASIRREGNILKAPSWVIESVDSRVVATWRKIDPPVILDGPSPKFKEGWDVYSFLFFAWEASITLNDREIPGKPYGRDIWAPTIGGERSSCVFALSEVFVDIEA